MGLVINNWDNRRRVDMHPTYRCIARNPSRRTGSRRSIADHDAAAAPRAGPVRPRRRHVGLEWPDDRRKKASGDGPGG
jgi:hypothetical protein